MHTAIQLFTVRNVDEPFPELAERVADAGYDGVELAGLPDDPAAFADVLDDYGIACAGVHVSHERLDEDVNAVTDAVESLGCESVIIPYLDDAHFESVDTVESTALYLAEIAARLRADDCRLFYHNHAHEFVDVDSRTAFDRLIDLTPLSVNYELDVGWAREGGRDPVDLLSTLEGQCPLVHIKDVHLNDGCPAEIGEGDVDLAACIDAAVEAGTEWFIYEHDEPDDPFDSLRTGAEQLDNFLSR